MNPEQLEQQEMEKLAGAASLVKELAEAHGIDIDNLTEEEAQDLIGQAYQALHGLEDQPVDEEKTASIIIKEFSETEDGMQKLAAAGQVGEELLAEDGLSPSDLTEEQAAEVLLYVLNNYDFGGEEEKTASVIVEEMSQDEEYMAKLAAAGEVAHEALQQEGLSADDLTEDQAAELLLNILAGMEDHEEKTAAVQEDLQQIAALREAGYIMYSGFADAMEKEAGVSMAGLKEALMKALGAAGAKGKAAGKWMLSPKVKNMEAAKVVARGKSPFGKATVQQRLKAALRGYGGELTRPVVPAAALAGGGGVAALMAGKKKK